MPLSKRPIGRPNRKAQIISAAEELMVHKGLTGVTTRAVADAVPCSEGAIYVHFKSRLELLRTVLENALPEMLIPLHALEGKIGKGTPKGNLAIAMRGLQKFHRRVAPMISSLFAETDLLKGFRQSLASRGKGPQGGLDRIVHYIRAEQKIGRVSPDLDAEAAAAAIMSISFFQAFTESLFGSPIPTLSADRVVSQALQTRRLAK